MAEDKPKIGAGGTSGGIVEFFVGAAMIAVGGYLFLSRASLTIPRFGFSFPFRGQNYQFNSFGLAMLPMLIGIGLLFYNNKNIWGWFLTVVGGIIIIVGVMANLVLEFQRTSVFDVLLMLTLVAGGLGLVGRALQPHDG